MMGVQSSIAGHSTFFLHELIMIETDLDVSQESAQILVSCTDTKQEGPQDDLSLAFLQLLGMFLNKLCR